MVARGLLLRELRSIEREIWRDRNAACERAKALRETLEDDARRHVPPPEPKPKLPLIYPIGPDYTIAKDECPLHCEMSVAGCIARQRVMDIETKRNPDRPWELRRHDTKRGAKTGRFPRCCSDACHVGRKYRRILGDDLARGVRDGARSDLAEQAKARARYEASHQKTNGIEDGDE